MQKFYIILIILLSYSCNTSNLYKGYKLYRSDKSINYPKENLTIKFINDTTGWFINKKIGREKFIQTFYFSKKKNDYLIIEEVKQTDSNMISFKEGDTIVIDEKKLYYFYLNEENYFLSFKKKLFNRHKTTRSDL